VLKLIFILILFIPVDAFSIVQQWFVNSEVSLVSKTTTAELRLNVPQSFYAVGDTIMINLSIKCLADSGILVIDPEYFSFHCSLDPETKSIGCGLGLQFDDPYYDMPNMTRITKNELIFYSTELFLDSTIIIDNEPERYDIGISFRYWIYSSELECLTYPRGDPRRNIDKVPTGKIIFGSRVFLPGTIGIFIFNDLSDVKMDY